MEEFGMMFLRAVMFIVPETISLAACIYYLSKKITPDGILLTTGVLTGLSLGFFNIFILTRFYSSENYFMIFQITSVIAFLGSIAFGIGLLLLVRRVIEKNI